jgi:hypothetical protein
MNDIFLQNIKVSQFQNDCEANDCLLSAKISDQMMTRLKRIIQCARRKPPAFMPGMKRA